MTHTIAPSVIPLQSCNPPELFYPDISPQLLARVKQLWSAQGLDFDRCWRMGICSLPGFHALPRLHMASSSAAIDQVFLFDQGVLWIRAMHIATTTGHAHRIGGLTPAQWHGLAGITARLTEQLTALRLLALTELPMPAMQIARSVSEDVDMALVLLIRPKLAQRFADCRTVEETNEFWRRHIAGGRAFRTVGEKLYTVGIDHSADTAYAKWRKAVLTTLNTAVHSNILSAAIPGRSPRQTLSNGDSIYFATFRIHELCAYAQLVSPDLSGSLRAADKLSSGTLASLAAPISTILINQIQSLSRSETDTNRWEQAPCH